MTSREIEQKAEIIRKQWGILRNALVESDQTAWITIPGLETMTQANGNELEVSVKIGKAEDA